MWKTRTQKESFLITKIILVTVYFQGVFYLKCINYNFSKFWKDCHRFTWIFRAALMRNIQHVDEDVTTFLWIQRLPFRRHIRVRCALDKIVVIGVLSAKTHYDPDLIKTPIISSAGMNEKYNFYSDHTSQFRFYVSQHAINP